MKEEAIEKEGSSIVVPALISGVVGAGLALLLAPKSGREIRQDIGRFVSKAGEQASETMEQAQSAVSQAASNPQAAVTAAKEQLLSMAAPEEKSTTSIVYPIVIGSVVGAAIALLLAPKSGKEIREDIKDFASSAVEKSKDLYDQSVSAIKEAMEKGKEAAAEAKESIRPAA